MKSGPSVSTIDPSVLSPRELHTLIMLAQGYTCREIAQAMVPSVSVKTVDTHRGHALKKLGLRNASDLTRYAIKHGIIDADGNEVGAPESVEAAGASASQQSAA